MKTKFKIRKGLLTGVAVLTLFVFIGFSERQQDGSAVNDVFIKIDNLSENHFLDEQDVVRLMQLDLENLKGAPFSRLDLRAIEKKIKSDKHIKEAELYSDVKGNLIVRVSLHRPIARIVRNDAPDAYIAEDGTIMPVSEKFTSRVILISGAFVREFLNHENIKKHPEGNALMEMIEVIRKDEFWRAQIAQVDIDGKGRLNVLPQVGNQTIELGRMDNLEEKLRKLRIFYKVILPQMGWNKYKRISLEYQGQIVAE